jgi:hypothetical protein
MMVHSTPCLPRVIATSEESKRPPAGSNKLGGVSGEHARIKDRKGLEFATCPILVVYFCEPISFPVEGFNGGSISMLSA